MAVSNSLSAVVYFCVKLAVAVKVEVACWQREVFEYLPSTNTNTIEIHIQIKVPIQKQGQISRACSKDALF